MMKKITEVQVVLCQDLAQNKMRSFRLLLYIDYDIPLVSSHLTFFAIVGYCSN